MKSKRKFLASLLVASAILSSCSQEINMTEEEQKTPDAQFSSGGIFVEGRDAQLIRDNGVMIQRNLDILAKAAIGLANDPVFLEAAAQPLRTGVKGNPYGMPLANLITTDGTVATLNRSYMDQMKLALVRNGGTSDDVTLLTEIILGFRVGTGTVYPRVYFNFPGTLDGVSPTDVMATNLQPQFMAVSQTYSPGPIHVWFLRGLLGTFSVRGGLDVWNEKTWYMGISSKGYNGNSGGLDFHLKMQGETCACALAVTGACVEQDTGPQAIYCGKTDENCGCPGCEGASGM